MKKWASIIGVAIAAVVAIAFVAEIVGYLNDARAAKADFELQCSRGGGVVVQLKSQQGEPAQDYCARIITPGAE